MNKEQQIEEMMKTLNSESNCGIGSCDGCKYENGRSVNICISKKQAEALYNAGYRKVIGRDLAKTLNEEIEELTHADRIRKEAYIEVLNKVRGLLEGYVDTRDNKNLYIKMCENFGIEVEE